MSPPSDSDESKGDIKPITETQKKKKTRKGRLIVRNLSFKVNEEILRNHFSKYGEITEVNLLRKPDGKLIGCGFIQFTKKNHAAKAILSCSGKPLLGRVIIVDWAVPKSRFDSEQTSVKEEPEDTKIKEETISENEDEAKLKTEHSSEADISVQIKEEEVSGESETEAGVKKEESLSSDSDGEVEEIKDELDSDDEDTNRRPKTEDSESERSSGKDDDGDGNDDDDDGEEEEENEEGDEDNRNNKNVKKPRTPSNDVSEGRTVFVKNVPFRATNEELKECMEQYGQVIYALMCIDPLTEHPKGTAFVKFQKKESAEECLSAGTELMLHDQTLDVHTALNREELHRRAEQKKDVLKNRDTRNLYLVKEGVILAGSKAVSGVSVADMTKRLQLEQWKTQMLRNLNMFVSRTRLVVHNIPPSWTDSKLYQLFLKHAGPKAVIKEARIMRNMKDVDAQGVRKSKEYGFVTFTTHEHALQALRNVNNNPNVFSKIKRPIVAFSIENKAIMNIKQRRLQKSQAKNPLCMDRIDHRKNKAKKDFKNGERNYQLKPNKGNKEEEEEREEFAGVTARPGKVQLPSRYKLKKQAALHIQNVRKEKHNRKMKKKVVEQKRVHKEKMKDPQPKRGKKRKFEEDDRTFSSLVSQYKQKLMSVSQKKWYDT